MIQNPDKLNKPTVERLYEFLNAIIPPSLSLDWDNDGLLCCPSPGRTVERVLLSLDVTSEAVRYAYDNGCDVIVSHHPVIFKPLRTLTSPKLTALVKADIAVMSFHTRLDILNGGVNDTLSELLGLRDTEIFADGAGRIGRLEYAWDVDNFCAEIKRVTGSTCVKLARGGDIAYRVAVVSGSGGDFINEAIRLGADSFVSGEIGYHHMLDAAEAGMNAIEAGHFFTEKHILSFLEANLRGSFPDMEFLSYTRDMIEILK